MIDLSLLRGELAAQTKALILRKEPSFDVDRLIKLDEQVRSIRASADAIRQEKNNLAAQGAKGLTPELREKAQALGKDLKDKEDELKGVEQEFKDLYLSCANIPSPDIPVGNKEANKVIRTHGSKPVHSVPPKNHLELNAINRWFDMQAAATMTGAQFVLYLEPGVKVLYALTQLMLKNNVRAGFSPVMPPSLIAEKALYNSGNLPKFAGDFYSLPADGLCLIPTSEVSLTNLHADQILTAEQLPLRYTAWTSCFRREAGGYGSTERGLIRIHQFEKVELYSICKPEESADELERMVACGEQLLQQLGLHYRVSLLAAQDCSFCSTKTYDIEVWLPGQNQFYEVSSCSNCTDFQSRRSGIRYKKTVDGKPILAHTLNASALALPRLMVAIMETFQQPDGSIKLPPVLEEKMKELW